MLLNIFKNHVSNTDSLRMPPPPSQLTRNGHDGRGGHDGHGKPPKNPFGRKTKWWPLKNHCMT